jgi:hypothetical protein
MAMSLDQNAGRIYVIKIENTSFESVEEFEKFGNNLNELYTDSGMYLRLLTVKCQQPVPNTSITPTSRQITHNYISYDTQKFRRELYTYTGNIRTSTLYAL